MADRNKPNAPKPPYPLHAFKFDVKFEDASPGTETKGDESKFSGAFSEISGLEATMEPVAVPEGGTNWGQPQLAGRTTFATVIFRRGMTTTRHLWEWFSLVNFQGAYKHRMNVTITLNSLSESPTPRLTLVLKKAMPVKLKLADLNAASQEIGIEELHLVHEGLEEVAPKPDEVLDSANRLPSPGDDNMGLA